MDADLYFHYRFACPGCAGTCHESATVSGRVVGGNFLWGLSAGHGKLLRRRERGRVGRHLSSGACLKGAHDVHGHKAQDRGKEQERRGKHRHGSFLPR